MSLENRRAYPEHSRRIAELTRIVELAFLLLLTFSAGRESVTVWASPISRGFHVNRVHRFQPEVSGENLIDAKRQTLSVSNFRITFDELGYDEETLESPLEQETYAFRLPQNWVVAPGSTLDLEFSYFFTELEQKEDVTLNQFGELSISVDGSLLGAYALNDASFDRGHWRVDLPPSLFNEKPGDRHEIVVTLNAWFLCDTAHIGKLVIHPQSTLSLNYTLTSPTLDLAAYPRPFSQWSFEPDYVQFILPEQPSEAEIRTAAVVAAGLGDMAGGNMVISATTDVDWLRMMEADRIAPEHLFVIGRPDRNRLLTWLRDDEGVSFPMSMRDRELKLSSRGPRAVKPGDIFTYTISLTNTTSARVQGLTLIDHLPPQADLVSCQPDTCRERVGDQGREAYWSLPSLSPGARLSFSLMLQLTETVSFSPTIQTLENQAILVDRARKPVNVTSLASSVGEGDATEVTLGAQSDFFFVQDEQPAFEEDGVLQELLFPRDPQKVILLITGLSDAAVHKAGQALDLRADLFGMEGPAALVKEVRSAPPTIEPLETAFTFADLGYGDRTTYGFHPRAPLLDYWFDVPRGWHDTNEAYLRLIFNHSQAIDVESSALTILLNGAPVATIPLVEEDADDLLIDIPSTYLKPGARNRVSIRPAMQMRGDEVCENIPIDQAWVSVSRLSSLHLGQQVTNVDQILDLDDFPFPFNTQPDLGDVLFMLPLDPSPVELEASLQMAFALGGASGGDGTNLTVSLGEASASTRLQDYYIVAIGRPTRNPVIQEINSSLPQPFIPGADEVENRLGKLILRLPPDVSLGYVQEFPSPWNETLAFLVVTGTSDKGVAWAASALNRQAWRFSGNLALVREAEEGFEVRSFDTRRLTSSGQAATLLTAVPELTPVSTPTVTPTLETEDPSVLTSTPTAMSPGEGKAGVNLPVWVMAFIGITGMTVVVMLLLGLWRFRSQSG